MVGCTRPIGSYQSVYKYHQWAYFDRRTEKDLNCVVWICGICGEATWDAVPKYEGCGGESTPPPKPFIPEVYGEWNDI